MTDAELVGLIRAEQNRIRLTAGHRYQVLRLTGAWEYVLGTTTIIKQTLAAPQLLDWAARLGAETGDPKAHIKHRDDAADKGTSLHALIERECRLMLGEPVSDLPPATEDELQALERWRKWARDAEFRPLAVEFRVYHGVLDYAGTVDVLGYLRPILANGQRGPSTLAVADWKSGNRVYAEHHLQGVAYRCALAQMTGCDVPAGYLVRVPRDGDRVAEKHGTHNVEATMKAFEGLIAANLWQRQIRKEMEAA